MSGVYNSFYDDAFRGTVRASAKAPALRAQISGLYLAPDGVEQRDHYMRLLTEDALLLGQIG